jgi:phytoene dehydrogenase-like protein
LTTADGVVETDAVVWNGDCAALERLLPPVRRRSEPSLSGFALMLAVGGRQARPAHHRIAFPAEPDRQFDTIFSRRRQAGEPTLYVSTSSVSDPADAPSGCENWFVLVNAPAGGVDWVAEGDAYEELVLRRLAHAGLEPPGPVLARARRTPRDLERESGAVGGAIYGAAPHGRLRGTRRPALRVAGTEGLWRVGGSVHPGGGLPLVVMGAETVARELAPA